MDRFMVDQFLLQITPDHLDQLLDHRTGSIHRFWQLTFVQANSSTIFTTLPLSGDFWKIWDYIIWWYYHMWPYLTPWRARSWFTRQIGLLQSTSYTDCLLFWQVFCHFAFQNSYWYISGPIFWGHQWFAWQLFRDLLIIVLYRNYQILGQLGHRRLPMYRSLSPSMNIRHFQLKIF